jgi:hypothetical protein
MVPVSNARLLLVLLLLVVVGCGRPAVRVTQAPELALADQVHVTLTDCTEEAASGTVTNNADITVTIYIDVEFLDNAGVIVDNGIDSVSGVRPGETAKWEARFVGDAFFSQCRGNVRSVFPE